MSKKGLVLLFMFGTLASMALVSVIEKSQQPFSAGAIYNVFKGQVAEGGVQTHTAAELEAGTILFAGEHLITCPFSATAPFIFPVGYAATDLPNVLSGSSISIQTSLMLRGISGVVQTWRVDRG